ncbi:hypothetical protein LLE49_08700 [Alicyclobacillus tolerans]|uniref:hypothetical protein n=1 Tax=Alicyclobacillus tolerans TaxID=90970 RepID=UPI001F20CC2A|nr:hypothetical protein [Alicyclobacillus tolerans]MCF8564807.1 hypothetical protein [Alicyclobacillus tolerans]
MEANRLDVTRIEQLQPAAQKTIAQILVRAALRRLEPVEPSPRQPTSQIPHRVVVSVESLESRASHPKPHVKKNP